MQVIVSAHVAKRPTTQPNQNARNKDPHPANYEGGEREPNEGHIGRQPLVASPQCRVEVAILPLSWVTREPGRGQGGWGNCGLARGGKVPPERRVSGSRRPWGQIPQEA